MNGFFRMIGSLRRAPAPVQVEAGSAAWTAVWAPRRASDSSAAMRVELAEMTPEAALSEPERFGERLGERLRSAGFRETAAVLTIPLDWTAALRVPRPAGLTAEDLADYLDLQAERVAPFGGTGWRLASPPDTGDPAAPELVGAVMPASRWSAIEEMGAAARLRWVSVRTHAPAAIPNDTGAALDLMPFGSRLIVGARKNGRLLDWFTLPGGLAGSDFAARMAVFLAAAAPDASGGTWRVRWAGVPDPAMRSVVENGCRTAGLPPPSESAPDGGVPFEFVRAFQRAPFRGLALLRRMPKGGQRALAVATALLVAGIGARGLTEMALRVRARRHAPAAHEAAELQERARKYRPWLEAEHRGAPLLEALAGCFPEEGSVWARRVELKEEDRVMLTGAARTSADALALLERLRQTPGVRAAKTQYLRGADPVQFAIEFEWRPGP